MESLLLLRPPFEEELILIPLSVGNFTPLPSIPTRHPLPRPCCCCDLWGLRQTTPWCLLLFWLRWWYPPSSPPLPPFPPPPHMLCFSLTNQIWGGGVEKYNFQSKPPDNDKWLWKIKPQWQQWIWRRLVNTLIIAFSLGPPPRFYGKIKTSIRGAVGGGNNGGKEESSAPWEAKKPIRSPKATKRNDSTRNSNWMMEDTGCLRWEEGGAVCSRPSAAHQP